MKIAKKRNIEVLSKFQQLLGKENNYKEICDELCKLIPVSYMNSIVLKEDGTRWTPGNLFTWLVMNGIVIDPKEVLRTLKCSVEIEDGELGLAGPVPTPFFQPLLI